MKIFPGVKMEEAIPDQAWPLLRPYPMPCRLFLMARQTKCRAGVGCMQHFGNSGLVVYVVA